MLNKLPSQTTSNPATHSLLEKYSGVVHTPSDKAADKQRTELHPLQLHSRTLNEVQVECVLQTCRGQQRHDAGCLDLPGHMPVDLSL